MLSTIAFDNDGGFAEAGTQVGGVETFSHTVGTGADRILFVTVHLWQTVAGTGSVTGITYGGVALTKGTIATQNFGQMRVELWYLVAPASGSNSVAVTLTGSTDGRKLGAISFSGVDQTTPIAAVNGAAASAASNSLAVTPTVNGSWMVDALTFFGTGGITPGAGQTQSVNNNSGFFTATATWAGPVSSTSNMSWTAAGAAAYGYIVVAISPANHVSSPPAEPTASGPNTATHVMGVGARGNGVIWRGAANYNRPPGKTGRGGPEVSMPTPSRASFTLRRKGGSEASVDFDQPRGSAWVVQELVTDLWWRRYDPKRKVIDNIGRFNADNVDTSCDGQSVSTAVTWVDYTTVLSARLVPAIVDYIGGTAVTTILAAAIPTNIDIDLTSLGNVVLGSVTQPVHFDLGTTVGDVFTAVQEISPGFDWAVLPPDSDSDFPILTFWPGGRGNTASGIVLFDAGTGMSPIKTWRRQVEGSDYATTVVVIGDGTGVVATATIDTSTLPAGPRDFAVTEGIYKTIATANARALSEVTTRSTSFMVSWTIELMPNFWEGLTHINVGDTITIAVTLGSEVLKQDTVVEEISCELDVTTGREDVTITTGKAKLPINPRSRNAAIPRLVTMIRKKK